MRIGCVIGLEKWCLARDGEKLKKLKMRIGRLARWSSGQGCGALDPVARVRIPAGLLLSECRMHISGFSSPVAYSWVLWGIGDVEELFI